MIDDFELDAIKEFFFPKPKQKVQPQQIRQFPVAGNIASKITAELAKSYYQSDITLIKDTTEYSTNLNQWVEKISFDCTILTNPNSIFRMKFDVKNSTNYKHTMIKGDFIADGTTTNVFSKDYAGDGIYNTWVSKVLDDMTALWAKDGILKIYLKQSPYGHTAYFRNFEICGSLTPFMFS